MSGDADGFRLTEHGRAQLEDLGSGSWYLNSTREQINHGIARTCAPYSALPCPHDNATAMREWRERGSAAGWVVPPWVEVYSRLPQ